MNTDSKLFQKKIEELTNQYYTDNKKNLLIRSIQKMDCASQVTNQIGIDELIHKTIYLVPNTNNIFIDYTIFKTYAIPENYSKIVEYILKLFDYCIDNYGEYNSHVNLDTFTISAAERYKSIIECFLTHCISSNSEYSLKLKCLYIYNTPNTFQNISKILMKFIDPIVKKKFIFYDKKTSGDILRKLFVVEEES
jgi:hypothetical protein